MAWTTALAIYFVIWWLVLFCVLPFGVRNASEAGETVEAGTAAAGEDGEAASRFARRPFEERIVASGDDQRQRLPG